ncbi:hypothetical protein [Actinoallomurus rhizosphaericola]|uniref:hypothetical protein n=1 Tax=Actinoallomurus rhizosphaericola TaxID=2952536 RepID=UPI002090B15A|nr:hypothetical protein [Actinoallomurus rhizosphaericola]MCO5994573.1 hypothetical protein [Actinoallomurus rhizosphaericola]
MPSLSHESLALLFKNRPALAAEILHNALKVDIPGYKAVRVESDDLTEWNPAEFRADAVVVFEADSPVLAVVVEIQLGRDQGKRWSWPVYLAGLRARTRCPAILLVICTDAAVGDWCAEPIGLGHPGWTLTPLVLKPEAVPVVTDAAEAVRAPELAVLSTMTHGAAYDRARMFHALLSALARMEDGDRAKLYIDIVLAALPETPAAELEAFVRSDTSPYKSEAFRRTYAEGEAEGEVKGEVKGRVSTLLQVLEARGVMVPDEARERITACTDVAQIEAWVKRSVIVRTVDALFD